MPLGIGPEPLPLRRLTAGSPAGAIRAAVEDESYLAAAKAMAERLAGADSITPVVRAIERATG